jgi:Protein of unknown function (DUF5132)
MRFSPFSFLLGIAAASLLPVISRVFRPLAVEATAAGMGMLEDARRIVAEQVETLEDIVAEARARREHLDADAVTASLEQMAEETGEEPATVGRGRRRAANGGARRRS